MGSQKTMNGLDRLNALAADLLGQPGPRRVWRCPWCGNRRKWHVPSRDAIPMIAADGHKFCTTESNRSAHEKRGAKPAACAGAGDRG